jgi:hypothetical protein
MIYHRRANLSYENILFQTDVFIKSVKGPKKFTGLPLWASYSSSTVYTSGFQNFGSRSI